MDYDEDIAGVQIVSTIVVVILAPLALVARPLSFGLNETSATLISVLLGASLAIATQAFFSHRQFRDERLATAYAVFHKVQLYSDLIGQMSQHIRTSERLNDGGELWRFLEPFYFHNTQEATFTPAELAVFSGDGDIAYSNDLMNFASLHNLLLFLMSDYGSRRETLERLIEEHVRSTGAHVSAFPSQVLDRYPIQVAKVSSRAQSLSQVSAEGWPHTERIVATIGPKIKERLRDPRFKISLARAKNPGASD